MKVLERFLTYVKFDTTANENNTTCPSTPGQTKFANYLVGELKGIGISDAQVDSNGYIMGSIPSNIDKDVPTVGFIAHMDTSDAISGKDVKPKVVTYHNQDIVLNEELGITLSNKMFKELDDYIGEELVVTDGTTLLGADDKAGIAEIITAMERIIEDKSVKHGRIRIAFTPDEEIGRGADLFDVKKFDADFAYTIDGGIIGELQHENFNAASAKIKIKGTSVHPGDAFNKMVNAAQIATEIAMEFPLNEVPEKSKGYDGFYHLHSIEGNSEEASLSYIIRDFDKDRFETKKQTVQTIVKNINNKYGNEIVNLVIKDQYYNMEEKLKEKMFIVDIAKKAMKQVGVTPKIKPIRGGTDGSRLSFMGLPTPNIFTGGHNFHGKYEYIPVNSMKKAVAVIKQITENIGNE